MGWSKLFSKESRVPGSSHGGVFFSLALLTFFSLPILILYILFISTEKKRERERKVRFYAGLRAM